MNCTHCMIGRSALAVAVMVLALTAAHAQTPGRDATTSGAAFGQAGTPPSFTRAQIEEMEARVAAAQMMVERLAPEAKARGLASTWRQATLEMLLPLSVERLQEIARQPLSLDAVAAAAREPTDDSGALGDPSRDLVYWPIPPCRFIDTRVIGGKIDGVRGFDVDNPNYGGSAGCDPVALFGIAARNVDEIAALAMNVTLVDTSTAGTPGFVAVKPNAAAPPTSLLNWHQQGVSVQIANQGIVSLDQSGGPASVDEFVIQTSGPVQIVVDLFGAFIRPQATLVETVQVSDFVVVPHLAAAGVESPVCPAGYMLTGGGCYADLANHWLSVNYPGGGDNRWACRGHNVSGVSSVLRAYAVCSRVPGR